MAKEASRNIRLGIIVLIGTVAIVAALYFVGRGQNMFGSTLRISASFYNVNGLRKGNSVRFTGIDVGTVEEIEILSDTSVLVTMIIDEDIHRFIRKDAVASIGTDGVMGNKLVNINPVPESRASPIKEGDVLKSLKALEMDATIRTLNSTSDNINAISLNLLEITDKFNNDNTLMSLLGDKALANNVRFAMAEFRLTGENTAVLTGNLNSIVRNVKAGNGTAGLLLSDTLLAHKFRQIVVNVHSLSDSLAVITGNFQDLSESLKRGEGTIGMLLTDTVFAQQLVQSVEHIKSGAGNFSQGMEAMNSRWPFRKKKKLKTEDHMSDKNH